MTLETLKHLTPRSKSGTRWYNEIVQKAQLADYSPVKGCMVIRPYGYGIWENIQKALDKRFKERGVKNAYFPMFIPYSFIEKEKEHVAGFAPEIALVTKGGGKKLKDPLVVRPTSETIIYDMFAKWVDSYKNLPIRVNQWCNVVRWEKRTTPFLRTTEFLWQEGHTAHATQAEADQEVREALNIYEDFVKSFLALPVIKGRKTKFEIFPGADYTTTIEALVRSGKFIQAGTSHQLGQNFSKVFKVKYVDKFNKEQYVWNTSWGMSTRIVGTLILMHGDDKGLMIPPRVAPVQVVIIPIYKNSHQKMEVAKAVSGVENLFKNRGIRFETDWSDNSPGWKFSQWELKGVPLRIEIGPLDIKKKQLVLAKRTGGEKEVLPKVKLDEKIEEIFDDIQGSLYSSAEKYLKKNVVRVNSLGEAKEALDSGAKAVKAFFAEESKKADQAVRTKLKLTPRLVPFESEERVGKCIFTGKEGKLAVLGKAY